MPDADRATPAPLTIDALLATVREHGGLPSVGRIVGQLSTLLESDTEAVQELADVILADVSLTQRLLRIANTVPFRSGPQAVTTVTRAIMLLGFNQVRSAALGLVLLEGVLAAAGRSAEATARIRAEFHQALLASSLARELLAPVRAEEAEEAGIAGMFRNVGRLLLAVYAPETLAQMRQAMAEGEITEAAAARRVLGRSLDELTERALRDWQLPDRITAGVTPLPPRIESPTGAADRVRAAAQFADEVAAALQASDPMAAERQLTQVLDRFAPAFAIERSALMRLLDAAAARTRDFELACGMAPQDSPLARLLDALPRDSQLAPVVVEAAAERDAVGRPHNARDILLAGLADATDALARATEPGQGPSLNDIVRIVLEAMYCGLGYARTALVLRDPAAGVYRTRAAFGTPKLQLGFALQGPPHLFAAALAQATDLHIADVTSEKVQASLPDWFRRDCPQTKSFLLMPLVVAGKPVGFFYADRMLTDPRGLAPEELNLLRTLRNQVVLAMRGR
jgi:HD-like signal output (HDOD) protein